MKTEKDKQTQKNITLRFTQFRKELKLSRHEIAGQLGLTGSSYGKYERGETFPGLTALEKLIKRFNLSLNWLLTGEGEMFLKNQQLSPTSPLISFTQDTEIQDLLTHMHNNPLFRHQILTQFHKFKAEFTSPTPTTL